MPRVYNVNFYFKGKIVKEKLIFAPELPQLLGRLYFALCTIIIVRNPIELWKNRHQHLKSLTLLNMPDKCYVLVI